ncbi:hypothetical protein GN958_ATG21721 [Phytophthora infestans]|uniref:Uncharacterized protein n=1 Tax=Phytophthora infestans TaxID=4787 RepID=A0A8S9TJL6_PHYIN|nr:hypothetical protein GN958_ATG21721 [Phytophthora infestans]
MCRCFTVGTKKVYTECHRQSVAAFSVALGADAELARARHELYGPGFRRLLAGEKPQEIVDKVSPFILADEDSNMDIDDIEIDFELLRYNLSQYMFAVPRNCKEKTSMRSSFRCDC